MTSPGRSASHAAPSATARRTRGTGRRGSWNSAHAHSCRAPQRRRAPAAHRGERGRDASRPLLIQPLRGRAQLGRQLGEARRARASIVVRAPPSPRCARSRPRDRRPAVVVDRPDAHAAARRSPAAGRACRRRGAPAPRPPRIGGHERRQLARERGARSARRSPRTAPAARARRIGTSGFTAASSAANGVAARRPRSRSAVATTASRASRGRPPARRALRRLFGWRCVAWRSACARPRAPDRRPGQGRRSGRRAP